MRSISIPFPNILPAPDGSIDLNWDSENINLLINVPADPSQVVSFYGEDHNKKELEGSIELQMVSSILISWLMSNQ